MFAQIAVNVPAVNGVFDYVVPQGLAAHLGCLVTVPFGRQTVQGVIVGLVSEPSVRDVRPILELIDEKPVLTAPQIELARQLADSTLNPLAAMVELMLPTGLSQQADTRYSLFVSREKLGELGQVQKRVIDLLVERGDLRGRQIDAHVTRVDWRKAILPLVKRGAVRATPILPPPTVRPKFVRTAQLAVSPERAAEIPESALGKTDATRTRRKKALEFLIREPDIVPVNWVYAESGCNLADLEYLNEAELVLLLETEIFRDPLQNIKVSDLQKYKNWETFTEDQLSAWNKIELGLNEQLQGKIPMPYLLHGVTGSGKTELYLRAVAETLKRGRQAIVLVPEIALTPQTVRRFLGRFPGQVGVIHSKLSPGERYDTWRRARNGQLSVIIGARSALFAPLPNIGLIVADECHDGSYYQSEPPFYHAVSAAMLYARLCGAVCVLGSATPQVSLRYIATLNRKAREEREEKPNPDFLGGLGELGGSTVPVGSQTSPMSSPLRLVELPRRIQTSANGASFGQLPKVHIVDMREELKAGNRNIFSHALMEALAGTLERGEQAILYLNRRGTATYVFCRECGYVVKCPECETPLTQHVDAAVSVLTCHRCGYSRQMPKTCPACKSAQIRAYGLGSEKVEAEVKALFPRAGVLRWDWETTREKDAHELILSHFANHRADVLVGTQMLAKGLDLPLVTLVGIVLADVGLALPDPFAGERAFQLLTQVAGRAGRSERGGQVVLQTFMPENEVIQSAAGHDYAGFYAREIESRRQLGYPPFARLLRLEFRHTDAAEAEKAVTALAARLKAKIEAERRVETSLIGAAPCFFAKQGGVYRWQVVIRAPEPASLLRGITLPDGWRVEVDPVSLL